jgi:hypothetical protein
MTAWAVPWAMRLSGVWGQQIRAFAEQQLSPIRLMAKMPGREFMLVVDGNAGGKQLELAAQKLLEMVSVDLGEGDAPLHINARWESPCRGPPKAAQT